MLLQITPPARLDVTTKSTALQPGASPQLQNLDIRRYPGRTRRGQGVSRAFGVAGSSSTIVAAGVFVRRDCRMVLVDQSAGGTIRAHVGSGFSTILPPCVGPIPEEDEIADDEHGIPGGTFNAGDGLVLDGNGQAQQQQLLSSDECQAGIDQFVLPLPCPADVGYSVGQMIVLPCSGPAESGCFLCRVTAVNAGAVAGDCLVTVTVEKVRRLPC